MTIAVQESWTVKPERRAEWDKLWKRYLKYVKDNPKLFKEMKWSKSFTQMFGGTYGAQIELAEYNSLADYEKMFNRLLKDPGFMKIFQEAATLMDATTYNSNVWTSLE